MEELMKRISLIILILVFFMNIQLHAEVNEGALWRSAVFAGWGQQYNGQKMKGDIFILTEIVLLGTSVFTYILQDNAYNDYKRAISDFDPKWDTYKDRLLLCQISIWVTGLFYVYNLVDAGFLTDPPSSAETETSLDLKIDTARGHNYLMSYNRRF